MPQGAILIHTKNLILNCCNFVNIDRISTKFSSIVLNYMVSNILNIFFSDELKDDFWKIWKSSCAFFSFPETLLFLGLSLVSLKVCTFYPFSSIICYRLQNLRLDFKSNTTIENFRRNNLHAPFAVITSVLCVRFCNDVSICNWLQENYLCQTDRDQTDFNKVSTWVSNPKGLSNLYSPIRFSVFSVSTETQPNWMKPFHTYPVPIQANKTGQLLTNHHESHLTVNSKPKLNSGCVKALIDFCSSQTNLHRIETW